MPPARVVAVAPGSPAASTGIQPGDEVLALNGEAVRDVIRYQLQADEPVVELEFRRGGLEQLAVVEKPAGAPLGLELDSPVFDRVQTCDNHCPFCFIHQLPKGMRRSLYLKDDDYRLSFLYGNFTTLTRFTEADLERVVTEQLGPLYVSIHATDPDMREHTVAGAGAVLDTVGRWQSRFRDALGRRLVFAADESFVLARRPFPDAGEYEGFSQHENGIGMARAFQGARRRPLEGEPA